MSNAGEHQPVQMPERIIGAWLNSLPTEDRIADCRGRSAGECTHGPGAMSRSFDGQPRALQVRASETGRPSFWTSAGDCSSLRPPTCITAMSLLKRVRDIAAGGAASLGCCLEDRHAVQGVDPVEEDRRVGLPDSAPDQDLDRPPVRISLDTIVGGPVGKATRRGNRRCRLNCSTGLMVDILDRDDTRQFG
jgi:hypothetical protein